MYAAIVLVALATLSRIVFAQHHIWNFVPMGAIALYAGSRVSKRWAWAVPLAAMLLADAVLDHGTDRAFFNLTRWTVYLTLAATTGLGLLANRPKIGKMLLPGLSLGASVLFFLTTNFATWAEGMLYPLTLAGLGECFVKALPFFSNSVLADLVGTALLFSIGPLVERACVRIAGGLNVSVPASVPDPVLVSETIDSRSSL